MYTIAQIKEINEKYKHICSIKKNNFNSFHINYYAKLSYLKAKKFETYVTKGILQCTCRTSVEHILNFYYSFPMYIEEKLIETVISCFQKVFS